MSRPSCWENTWPASVDRFGKYGAQRPDAIVYHCRRVSLLVARKPILTIALTHFSDISFQKRWPGAFDKADDQLAIIFRARFERSARLHFPKIYLRRVADRHFPIGKRSRRFVTRTIPSARNAATTRLGQRDLFDGRSQALRDASSTKEGLHGMSLKQSSKESPAERENVANIIFDCWHREPDRTCLRVEVRADEIFVFPYQQFFGAHHLLAGGETLKIMFSTHEVTLSGRGMEKLLMALQEFAVDWIRPVPARYRDFQNGETVIKAIAVRISE